MGVRVPPRAPLIKSRRLEAQRSIWTAYSQTEEAAYRNGYAAFLEKAEHKRLAPLKPTRINDPDYLSYIERFNQNCLAFDTGWSESEYDSIHNGLMERYGLDDSRLGTMLEVRYCGPWFSNEVPDNIDRIISMFCWNEQNIADDWFWRDSLFYFRTPEDALLFRLKWS